MFAPSDGWPTNRKALVRHTLGSGLLACFFLLPACTTIVLPRAEDETARRRVEHHFGYVRVERVLPPFSGAERERIESLGIWVQQGVGLGFRRQDSVVLPDSCRVVFFIDNEALLQRTLSLIREQSGTEGLCAVEGQDFH